MLETVIGLEIHAELLTESKIFCACKNSFGGEPNTRCCPVCAGMPGTLPVLNAEAVKLCVAAGLAMNCEISHVSRMTRKNYFYPDLPKGYQISQLEMPLCKNGYVMISGGRKIKINRIQIEEDAGKLIHDASPDETLIDYNRCGVPLIEIVTEPDLRSADETAELLEKIKTLLKFTSVSDCKMQEGSLRCDVNVSVRKSGEDKLNQRVEYKNLNSFKAAVRAVSYEETRQRDILLHGKAVLSATMKWDDVRGAAILMRTKEEAMDYRFFSEPDIPAVMLSAEYIEGIRSALPPMPDNLKQSYMAGGLSEYEASLIANDYNLYSLFDAALKNGISQKLTASVLLGEYIAVVNSLNEEIIPDIAKFVQLLKLLSDGKITRAAMKKILLIMLADGGDPLEIYKGFSKIGDMQVRNLTEKAVAENTEAVKDYLNGRKTAFGYLVGQVMKLSDGRADPKEVKVFLEDILNYKLEGQKK